MTPHIEAKKEEIAKLVIMPGDPLRAKYIAEKYLKNYKLVNSVRNILAYTGEYKGKNITVMASGMGMPSMGIYCYELYKFYEVESIIRVGSCGIYKDDAKLLDTILVENSYTEGNFALNMSGKEEHIVSSDIELNKKIEEVAKSKSIKLIKANMACVECFDKYIDDVENLIRRFPKKYNIIGAEMEAFALFYVAKKLNKKASCLLTVVDTISKKESLSANQREKSLKDMIEISLESI